MLTHCSNHQLALIISMYHGISVWASWLGFWQLLLSVTLLLLVHLFVVLYYYDWASIFWPMRQFTSCTLICAILPPLSSWHFSWFWPCFFLIYLYYFCAICCHIFLIIFTLKNMIYLTFIVDFYYNFYGVFCSFLMWWLILSLMNMFDTMKSWSI